MIGEMKKRVILQAPANVQSANGEVVPSWVDIVTVWAQIKPLSGSEFFRAQQVNESLTTKLTIRYLKNVTPEWRVLFGDRVFNIHSVINPNEANRFLELLCEEVNTSE